MASAWLQVAVFVASVFLSPVNGNILAEQACIAVGEVESTPAVGDWTFRSR